MKKIIFLVFLIIVLTGCQQLSDADWNFDWTAPINLNTAPLLKVEYENKTIEEHTKLYDLTVDYPQFTSVDKTKQDKLNQEVKTKIDTIVNNFKDGANQDVADLPADLIGMLDINYGIDNMTSQLIAVHFDIYNYFAGAAHGFDYFETFNYDLSKEKKLSLMDIFRADTKYLDKFSALGNQYFSKKFTEEGSWHPEGVEPREENFRNFTLAVDQIIFYFDDYAIAAYAAGTQVLAIDLSDLNDYLLPAYQVADVPFEPEGSANNNLNTYEDIEYDFSFAYPKEYIYEDENLYMFLTENPLVSIGLPAKDYEGTNLSEAQFIVAASDDENKVESCEEVQESETDLGIEIINGLIFRIFELASPAAGNLYEITSYRLVDNDICYEVVLLLHSGNIGNYELGAVQEFNKEETLKKLKSILETFQIDNNWF